VITVEPRAAWCERHLVAPFRRRWPKGYVTATLVLVQQALCDDEIQAAASGEVAMLDRVLREFGPLCCRLERDVLTEIIRGALSDDIAVTQAMIEKYGPAASEGEAA
jgi:hypothetical protein